MRLTTLGCALAIVLAAASAAAAANDLGTGLMRSTFKLANGATNGAGFVLYRPAEGEHPEQAVLITAAHVLEQMKGDKATLVGRTRKDDGGYERLPVELLIRKDDKPLWTQHPSLDVALMAITLPDEVETAHLSTDLLADDEQLKRYEIHPGERLFCAGYPHAGQFDPSPAGFPLLRSGCLASYPLLPTAQTKTFLFDFNTFEGDSGGPVFLEDHQRFYGGKTHQGRVQLILGLVHGQHLLDERYETIYASGLARHRLGLSIIVHASAICETLEKLPR